MNIIDFGSNKEKGIILGIMIGVVTNTQDPNGLGRIKVKYPLMGNDIESDWMPVASFSAGNNCGAFFIPQVNTQVIIAFDQGNINLPYAIGFIWDSIDIPPVVKDQQQNICEIKTINGNTISFDNTPDQGKITITDAKKNQIMIETNSGKITISANNDIVINAENGNVTINANSLDMNATSSASLKAETIDIEASGHLSLKGNMIDIN